MIRNKTTAADRDYIFKYTVQSYNLTFQFLFFFKKWVLTFLLDTPFLKTFFKV